MDRPDDDKAAEHDPEQPIQHTPPDKQIRSVSKLRLRTRVYAVGRVT